MHIRHFPRAALLAVLIGAAVAPASSAGTSEQTRIDVRTKAGAVETLIVNEMKTGEVRSLTTASGNPALITRTDTGMKLDVAGESFDIALPEPGTIEAAALGPDAKVVKVYRHHDEDVKQDAHERVLIHKHHGDVEGAEAEAIAEAHAQGHAAHALAELAAPGPLADGQRIRVIRQMQHESTDAPSQ